MNKNNKTIRKRNKKNNRSNYRLPGISTYSTVQRPRFTFLDPHMYITLKYAQNVAQSVATLAGAQSTFRLNSIFDPDAAVGGTQPYGYDQLSALYNRYRVLKTGWKVTFTASTSGYSLVVLPTNGALASSVSSLATLEAAAMNPYAKFATYNLGSKPPVISGKMDLNVLGGVTRVEYVTDDRFEAQIGANPSEVISLIIGVYNPTGSTMSITYFVELWYEIDLHDPIPLVAS